MHSFLCLCWVAGSTLPALMLSAFLLGALGCSGISAGGIEASGGKGQFGTPGSLSGMKGMCVGS